MFKKLFGKTSEIYSPVNGESYDLAKANDPVFSQKMSGDGVAIKITGETFVAPADGELSLIFETNHAFALTLENGVELLVHIGIDTVELKGEGFTRLVEPGQKVTKGTPIIKINKALIESKEYSTDTMVLITNMDSLKSFDAVHGIVEAGTSAVIDYKL